MAGINLGGLASGLDTNAIIDQLMSVERQPRVRLQQQEALVKARQAALKDVATRLTNLKLAAADLRSPSAFADTQTVESSDPTRVAAARTSGVGPGSYDVAVLQTAAAAQRTYAYTTSGGATTLTVGGHSTAIAAGASLDDAVSAVNADGSATVYAANVGGQLVLSSRATGATGFTASGDVGLVEDAAKAKAGRDAQYQVDGGAVQTSASNVVTGAVPGLTLTLKSAGASTLTVGAPGVDRAAITAKVKAFVDQYDSTTDFIRSKLEEEAVKDPQTDADRAKGVLRGDAMLQGVLASLRTAISDPVPGNPSGLDQLAEIGVSTGATTGSAAFSQDSVAGRLVLDADKLTAALTANPAGVRQLLGAAGATGASQRLEGIVDPLTRTGGSIPQSLDSATAQIKDLDQAMAQLDQRLTLRETTLRAQFTRLETAMSQSQSLQAQLSAQLAGLR
jgi:flagellar hook-associated protein 2